MPKITIHESAQPAPLEAGMIEALQARRLPGRWLYEGAAQAERWLDYHRAWSPAAAGGAMGPVYDQAFAGAVQAMGRAEQAMGRAEQAMGRAEQAKDGAEQAYGRAEQAYGRAERAYGRAEQAYGRAERATAGCGQSMSEAGLHVVSLGCGGGRKDAALLRAARGSMDRAAGEALAYFPLDSSRELVGEAAAHVADALPGLPIHALVADLGAQPALDGWLSKGTEQGQVEADGQGVPRLFSCIGMVPNFDPEVFPRYLRSLLRPGDGLLISANLSPLGMEGDKADILAQYDNPPARRWYRGALQNLELGAKEAEDAPETEGEAELTVAARALAADGSAWQVVVEARLPRAAVIRLGEQQIAFEQGEQLELFFSNRFTQKAFEAVLARAGLELKQAWLHAAQQEGVFLCLA